MKLTWWHMPGPAAFLKAVWADLLAHRSSVIATPATTDLTGMTKAMAEYAKERSEVFRAVTYTPGQTPVECIWHQAGETGAVPLSGCISTLASHPCLCGCVLSVRCTNETWPVWKSFLKDWHHAQRAYKAQDRSTIVLLVAGAAKNQLPTSTAQEPVHVYDGKASYRDAEVFSAFLDAGGDPNAAWQRDLKRAVSVQLAQWDPNLLEYLLTKSLIDLLNFETTLRAYPGWPPKGLPGATGDDWATGRCQQGLKGLEPHSCWLLERGEVDVLYRRVWQAEITVLYPVLENYRQEFLARHGKEVQLPIPRGEQEPITDLQDMELQNLSWYFGAPNSPLPGSERKTLRGAVRIRNMLAHNLPLETSEVLGFDPK